MIGNNSRFFTKELIGKLVKDINVAFWVWEPLNDRIHNNGAFYELIGYEDEEDMTFKTWEQMVYPDDIPHMVEILEECCNGETDSFSFESRLTLPNGNLIWVSIVGKVTIVNEEGKSSEIVGIIQDITKRKTVQEQLVNDENKLRLAMQFAGFSIWEWDILNNIVSYDKNYASSLGYTDYNTENNTLKWASLVHPEDMANVKYIVKKCLSAKCQSYNHKLRIKKADGYYIWVRDIGEVSKVNEKGEPTHIIGGRINIDELERATNRLAKYHQELELKIQNSTRDLLQRDTILLELNQMSSKLMATPKGTNFNSIAYQYLEDFSSLQKYFRISVFRIKVVDGNKYFSYLDNTPKNPYKTDFDIEYLTKIFKDYSMDIISGGTYTEDQREEFLLDIIKNYDVFDINNFDFYNNVPTVYEAIKNNKTLNVLTSELTYKEFIFTKTQNVGAVIVSPIYINNELWGYILIDNEYEVPFPKEDEQLLPLLGSSIAQAIRKNELELIADDAIEQNKLMLNALPICCNLWENRVNISTNEEAVRMFELNSQAEYLEKFYDLSPEYQSCGKKSSDLIPYYFDKAEELGYFKFDWLHVNLKGEFIPCEVILVKIKSNGKEFFAGYTRDLRVSNKLLDEIKANQESYKIAHQEALLSSKAKSNFLANMSHEIRTPMNAISGMTDIILRETVDDNNINEYAINIKRACDSLLTIINDVLDISKIESGKLDIAEAEYSLREIIADVLTITTNRLETKDLMFICNIQPDLPDKIIGDCTRVKQIMINILNNAIKFTKEGYIRFDVYGEFAGGVFDLNFSITDTGIGISKEDIDKLFIEFERFNTTKNRSIEGTGLGLAISKRLAQMMYGTISLESTIDVGTTFHVSLLQKLYEYSPIAKVENNKSILVFESRDLYLNSIKKACSDLNLNDAVFCSLQSEFNEALNIKNYDYVFTSSMYLIKVQEILSKLEHKSKVILIADNSSIRAKFDNTSILIPTTSIDIANVLNGNINSYDFGGVINNFIAPECHVLVVDDNPVNIKVAQGLMRPYLFSIDTALDGLEAVKKINENHYDLVFMDHMMPIMDGIDATIAVRSLEGEYFKNLPIVALTANAIIGTRDNFIREGMNDFLAKPIKLSALNEIIAKWLPKDKQIITDNDNNNSDNITATNEKTEDFTISNIDITLGLSRVGGDFDTYIDILNMYYKDGVKRINSVRNFYDSKNYLNYKIEVHALKSASASIGAIDISEKAKLLEEAAIKEDWTYINLNTTEFIDDFNILLENIRESLKGIITEVDNSSKEMGELDIFKTTINELSLALDDFDVNKCEELLQNLMQFNWDSDKLDIINKINEFINSYEYDEAVEVIQSITM